MTWLEIYREESGRFDLKASEGKNCAWGDFMAACNLLVRGRAVEKEQGGKIRRKPAVKKKKSKDLCK